METVWGTPGQWHQQDGCSQPGLFQLAQSTDVSGSTLDPTYN